VKPPNAVIPKPALPANDEGKNLLSKPGVRADGEANAVGPVAAVPNKVAYPGKLLKAKPGVAKPALCNPNKLPPPP
jgi:hypothetical protein